MSPASRVAGGITLLSCLMLCLTTSFANPTGGTVTHGNATMDQNGNVLTINQGTDRLIMGWNSFSIGAGETTRFVQPNSSSMALNRVNGGTQSLINGRLEANGGVILINPAGIIVGNSGVVNVNSFIASTRDVTDSDFLSGKSMKFQGNSEASIQNLGTIHAESGYIYLIAHSIINSGTLTAEKGTVGLAAANEVLLQPAGDEKLSILSQEASGGKIVNSGTIRAVTAEIKAAGNPYAVAINLDGVIETHAHPTSGAPPKVTIRATQGDIQMRSGSKITANGKSTAGQVTIQTIGSLEIGGTVLATSSAGTGGTINLLGENIHLDSTSVVDASGFLGGGKIFVGGDYQGGKNATVHYSDTPLPTAQTLQVDQGAKLSADATGKGNGGVVIQWSDGTTVSSGSVSVQGGPLGGNGGFTEISGKQNLGFNGTVDLAAPNGKAGTVLFDPTTLYILSDQLWKIGSYPNYTLDPYNPTLDSPTPNNYSSLGLISVSQLANITCGTIELSAISLIEFFAYYETANRVPPTVNLQSGVNLVLNAPRIILDSGSSIKANGDGNITLNAGLVGQNINGNITTDAGNIILKSARNITLTDASITTTSGAIALRTDAGDIEISKSSISSQTGSKDSFISITATGGNLAIDGSIAADQGSVNLTAYKNGVQNKGIISLSDTTAITINSGDINFTVETGGTVFQGQNAEIIQENLLKLNNSSVESANGHIYLYDQGTLWLGGSYPTISSTKPNGILDNFSSPNIILAGQYISLADASILNANAKNSTGSLTFQSWWGDTVVSGGSISTPGNLIFWSNGHTLSLNNNPTFSVGSLSGSFGTIDASSIEWSSSSYSKKYDGTTDAPLSEESFHFTGINRGYAVTTLSGTATFNSPDVQSSENAVAINALVLRLTEPETITTSGEFILSIKDLSLAGSITPAIVTSSLKGTISRPYDGTTDAKLEADNYTLDGILAPDAASVSLSAGSGRYDKPDVTATTIKFATLLLSGTKAGNYNLETSILSGNGKITPAPLTALLSGSVTKPYDGTADAILTKENYQIIGTVYGTDTVKLNNPASGTFDTANAGSKKDIIVTGLALDNPNYQLVDGSRKVISSISGAIGTITPKSIIASYNGDSANLTKPYNGDSTTKIKPDTLSLNGIVSQNNVRDAVSIASTFTSAYADANAGNKKITVSGLTLTGDMAGNYLLTPTLDINGAITKKALTAAYTGAAITKVYDGNNTATVDPSLISLSGIVEGRSRDNVSINSTFTSTYDTANVGIDKTVTMSGLTLNGAMAGNYALAATLTGSGVITPATLTASLTGDVSKQYNGDTVAKISPANYILNGTIFGKDAANLGLNNPVTGSYDTANAGAGINVTVSRLALTGSAANNYQLASTTINAPIGTITALPPPPPPPPTGNGNSLTITGVISTPSFMRMVQAAVPPPPPPGPAGPAGPAGGGSFGSAGPSSGGGGFSQSAGEAVAGGPASAPPPQEGSGQSGAGASDPNSPPPAPGSGPVANNGSAPAANGAPVAANGSAAGGAVAGGSTSSGAAAGGASHAGGTAGSSSGSGSSGQAAAHLPASVVATTRLNSPVNAGNSAAASFNRLNPTISAGEGLSEGSSSSSAEAAPSQGAAQVNQSRASRFGGIGSDSTPGGDLNSMVQMLAL